MEEVYVVLAGFAGKYPIAMTVLAALGSLTTVMTIVAPMTETKKDDELLEKAKSGSFKIVWDFLKRFSLLNKK